MKAFKPLMFAALAGLPLAVLPAVAATTDTQTTTRSDGSTMVRQGTTYSETIPHTPGTNLPAKSTATTGGGESGGGSGSGK